MIFLVDVFSKEKRSDVMSKIRSKDTMIEVLVRKWLFSHGLRFRKNDKRYPGKPDIILPKYKTAIFIQGCFWHGHGICRYSHIPKSRMEYWIEKINKNTERDRKNQSELRRLGWNVIVIWECELKKNPEERLNTLLYEIGVLEYRDKQ